MESPASLTALWITRHAWGAHVIGGGDITADLVRSDFGIAHLLAHGRIDGWFPRFMLGHQEFLFNGPGVTWATGSIRAITFGSLSNSGATKVLGIAAIAAEPLGSRISPVRSASIASRPGSQGSWR